MTDPLDLACFHRKGAGEDRSSRYFRRDESWLDGLFQTSLGDHATVTNQHDALDVEAFLELRDLALQRVRVADIALEHLNRDRAALCRTQKPEDDLQLTLAVTTVTELGEWAGAALKYVELTS